MPQTAADLGLHYARVSVSGEPLQAAQFWTTLISLACVSSQPIEDLLRECLRAADPASAQAEAVQDALRAFSQHPSDWKAARQFFHDKWFYPKEKPWDPNARPRKWNDNSTPLNGAMVVLALLYGQGDFTRPANMPWRWVMTPTATPLLPAPWWAHASVSPLLKNCLNSKCRTVTLI
jgi:hypothetical protein